MNDLAQIKAIDLLKKVSTKEGFLASAENTSNYKRIWARDGVITGLAALASGNEQLIETFRNTLETLTKHQHENGTIPSNVALQDGKTEVSYGGLAGRVDAVAWYIIGICQYAYYFNNKLFFYLHKESINKCLKLLEFWEFNNKHLLYVPLSGNWADEYITDGYTLYDQLLRVWALRCYQRFVNEEGVEEKINQITSQIELNFTPNSLGKKYHERAYNELKFQDFMPCSFSPSGYKTQFDAFGNSLALWLNVGAEKFQNQIVDYAFSLASETKMGLIPAFWPPITQEDADWNLLKNNFNFNFKNFPNEFHNGGSWCMVNGFLGLALLAKEETEKATQLLEKINEANAVADYSFYENFNTQTKKPNGVAYCAWSGAAAILLHETLYNNFKLLK
jgi:GH15 family glucan-1,4-alpha-glucosidase